MFLELWCIQLKGQVLANLYRLTSMPGIPYGATFKQPACAGCFRCDAYGQYPAYPRRPTPIPAEEPGRPRAASFCFRPSHHFKTCPAASPAQIIAFLNQLFCPNLPLTPPRFPLLFQ